jgi:hypothetical protein
MVHLFSGHSQGSDSSSATIRRPSLHPYRIKKNPLQIKQSPITPSHHHWQAPRIINCSAPLFPRPVSADDNLNHDTRSRIPSFATASVMVSHVTAFKSCSHRDTHLKRHGAAELLHCYDTYNQYVWTSDDLLGFRLSFTFFTAFMSSPRRSLG